MATNHLVCCERLDESKYRHKCACPSATFECESEQIDPTLCGHGEYVGFISTPPKKYRLETDTRSFVSYTLNKCCQPSFLDPYEVNTSFIDASTSDYTRTQEYHVDTCAVTTTTTNGQKTRTSYSGCPSSPSGTINGTYNDICGGYVGNLTGGVVSAILEESECERTDLFSQSAEDECIGEVQISLSGSGTLALSVEDTDQDAIDRETPVAGTSCSSLWETRSTGFSFTDRTSGYTIECVDLVIGYEYEVTPAIRKRTAVIGSYGAWEDVVVTPVTFTATAKTHTIDDAGDPIELDHIQGYEYEITDVNIEKTA